MVGKIQLIRILRSQLAEKQQLVFFRHRLAIGIIYYEPEQMCARAIPESYLSQAGEVMDRVNLQEVFKDRKSVV